MKKMFFLLILFTLVSFKLFAQKDTITSCDFYKHLTFKNGKAVVVVKATYQSMFRSPEDETIKELSRRKLIRLKDYFRPCCDGVAIAFIPENCALTYNTHLNSNITFDIDHFKIGSIFYLTCTFFKGAYDNVNHRPFFAVTDISLTPPQKAN